MDKSNLLYRFFLDPMAHGMVCFLLAYLLAPMQFLKVVYQETKEGYLAIARRILAEDNAKVFFSGAHMYALRQFISAFAFGVSQWLYLFSLRWIQLKTLAWLVIWQSFLIAVVETAVTIYTEMKEIAANKGTLLESCPTVADIITPIFLRNVIAASAPVLAYEVTKNIEGLFLNAMACMLFSIAVSALTIPFDLIATQNCGSMPKMTWVARFRENLLNYKLSMLFDGLAMRIVQIVPYSIAHSLIILILS